MSDKRELIESLSPRQREILIYVAQHLSSKEIGRLLGIAATTVDSHVAALLQRLQLNSRRDAAVLMIELGYTSRRVDLPIQPPPTLGRHGGDQRSNRHPLPILRRASIFRLSRRGRDDLSGGDVDETRSRTARPGMGQVVLRCLFDGFFIILFFSVMAAVASGVQWIVIQWEQHHFDPIVLFILKAVSYMLVGLDAVGVVTATGLLTYRFVRAIAKADD